LKFKGRINRDIQDGQDKSKSILAADKICPAAAAMQLWRRRHKI
jgi:hypothetical protein